MRTRWFGAFAGLGVAVLMVTTTAADARADIYGWKWAKTTITVHDGTHTTPVKNAIGRWDAVTPLDIHAVGGQTADISIDWGDTVGEYGFAGTADWTWTNGQVTHCTILLDRATFKDRYKRRAYLITVALHEIGHCLGLAHTTDLTVPSVMDATITSNWQYPQTYDVGQLALLYG